MPMENTASVKRISLGGQALLVSLQHSPQGMKFPGLWGNGDHLEHTRKNRGNWAKMMRRFKTVQRFKKRNTANIPREDTCRRQGVPGGRSGVSTQPRPGRAHRDPGAQRPPPRCDHEDNLSIRWVVRAMDNKQGMKTEAHESTAIRKEEKGEERLRQSSAYRWLKTCRGNERITPPPVSTPKVMVDSSKDH